MAHMENRFHAKGRGDYRKAIDCRARVKQARRMLRLKYADELASAGLLAKFRIHLRIRSEARETVGASDHALFSSARR